MKKSPKLSAAEIFFIQEKSKAGESAVAIASTLGLKVEVVVPHVLSPQEKTAPQETTSISQNEETLTSQSFARHKTRPGIVVMTEAASQMGDAKAPVSSNPRNTDCIAPTKKQKVVT